MYTGKSFNGAKAYSRMMSIVFVILMYSSGMPILYLIGSIWFFCTYNLNKMFILKYLQRTITMNRIIPVFSIDLLKAALTIHMINALMMLTNPEPFMTENESGNKLTEFNMVKDAEVV